MLFPESEFGKKSEARNRLLADLLTRTDFMEKAGTGIKRVTDACDNNDNKITFNFSDSFWVTIKTNIHKDNNKDVPVNVPVNDRQKAIIAAIQKNNNITINQLAYICKVNEKTIRRNLKKLTELKFAKRIGSEKTGHWEIIN